MFGCQRKIELTLQEMLRCEQAANCRPTLVHCDSIVTDSNLNVLKKPFIGRRGRRSGLSALLFANCVQGCTTMMNAPLREQVLRMEPILPYDYHSALIAAALGQRRFINKCLLLYRQHTHNRVGAGIDSKPLLAGDKRSLPSDVSSTLQLAINNFPYIQKTLEFYKADLPPEVIKEMDDFSLVLFGKNTMRRLFLALRHHYAFYRRRDRLKSDALHLSRTQHLITVSHTLLVDWSSLLTTERCSASEL